MSGDLGIHMVSSLSADDHEGTDSVADSGSNSAGVSVFSEVRGNIFLQMGDLQVLCAMCWTFVYNYMCP